MEELTQVFEQYGYLLLFGVGFLEFIGAPVAGVPLLIAAGGLAAMGGVSVPVIVLTAAVGGLMADVVWYGTARFHGRVLVDSVCGLSSNPKACILGVERRLTVVGPRFLLFAKFVPGAGNLVAVASGFGGTAFGTFILLDGLGVLAWAGTYTGVGWAFSAEVERAIGWFSGMGLWVVAAVGLLIGAGGFWRILKVRMHRIGHRTMAEGPK